VDTVQPDVCYLGGPVRLLQVAAMASKAGLPCVPHSANRSLLMVFTLHLMAAIENVGPYVEYSIEETPWTRELYAPALDVRDGAVQAPDGPGWGVTINPEWLLRAERQESAA
jgi:L-alanine-DL-glutamate epimerase-like enolase superfamily enzyme